MKIVKAKLFKNICSNCSTKLWISTLRIYVKCKVLGKQRYCSHKCLKEHTASMHFEGAIHHIHQMFGGDHPVTRAIQRLREEHRILNKIWDSSDRAKRGKQWEEIKWKKFCHNTEKSL
jgi:hypothetical protein